MKNKSLVTHREIDFEQTVVQYREKKTGGWLTEHDVIPIESEFKAYCSQHPDRSVRLVNLRSVSETTVFAERAVKASGVALGRRLASPARRAKPKR